MVSPSLTRRIAPATPPAVHESSQSPSSSRDDCTIGPPNSDHSSSSVYVNKASIFRK